MDYKRVTSCRVCKSGRLLPYLDLGSVPLCNKLPKNEFEKLDKYPIELMLCEDCCLSQLSVVVNPEVLYRDYVYHSSVSQTFKNHCYEMAANLKMSFEMPDYPLVVDIASNDGCLLEQFRKAGFTRLLGFEPAENLSKFYDNKNVDKSNKDCSAPIMVVPEFFSESVARKIKGDRYGGQASIITATNVFAHVDDLGDFLRGVDWILDDNGVFIVEVPYLANLINGTEFDTIYHEHLSYFLLKPLVRLFNDNNLQIFRVEQYPIHGGSIRIYASKNRSVEQSVLNMLEEEETTGLYSMSTYTKFSERVEMIRERFKTMMELLFYDNKKVIGYGASAKGISLLNYCGIDNKFIASIVDDTQDKQGKLTPGSNIPIVSYPFFEAVKPDVIVLLAWNFSEELMRKTAWHKELGGYYLVPIPDVMVI